MHADLPDLDLVFLTNVGARHDLDIDVFCLLGIELHCIDRFGDLKRLGQAVAGMGAVGFRGLLEAEKRDRASLDADRAGRRAGLVKENIENARAVLAANILQLEEDAIGLARRVGPHGGSGEASSDRFEGLRRKLDPALYGLPPESDLLVISAETLRRRAFIRGFFPPPLRGYSARLQPRRHRLHPRR